MDRTLILVKPDAFARGLTGEIIARFERKGLRIVALKHMTVDEDLAKRHYAEHEGKPFFGELVEFITSGAARGAWCSRASEAVTAARQVIGATNPLEAAPGSIRGDFAIAVGQNMVHGSDSPESAAREAALFFPELCQRARAWPGAGPPGPRLPVAPAPRDPRAARRRLRACARRTSSRRTTGAPGRGRGARTRCARRSPARRGQGEVVLGVDTLVATGLEIWGKPPNEDAARETLRRLAGRTHRVVSGVALVARGRHGARARRRPPSVTFRPLDDATIDWYVATGEWEGRAGGYAIQGRGGALVERDRRRLPQRRRAAGRPLLRLADLLGTGPRQRRPDAAAAASAVRRLHAPPGPRFCRRFCAPPGTIQGEGEGAPLHWPRGRRAPQARRRGERGRPLTHGLLQLPHRLRWPRHGGRPRHGEHARLRPWPRDRAVRAQRGRDRLAHRRGPRRRHRGQADARPHARARSRRSGR